MKKLYGRGTIPRVTSALIELHVPDFEVVKEFYSRLGFVVEREDPPLGKSGYLVLTLEDNQLSFWCGNNEVYTQSYFQEFPRDTKRGYGVEIVLQISNLREYFDTVREKVVINSPLRLRQWGIEDFRVVDPFGYYLRFTSLHDPLSKKH